MTGKGKMNETGMETLMIARYRTRYEPRGPIDEREKRKGI
jgi:hypothetical protein